MVKGVFQFPIIVSEQQDTRLLGEVGYLILEIFID